MKRGAEKQLSKDDASDEDVQELPTDNNKFKIADESTLATRQIRGLPKRALAGTPPPTTTNGFSTPKTQSPGSSTPAKFGGFTGFGGSSSGTFSFTPPQTPTSTFSSVTPFNLASTTGPSSLSSLAPNVPAVASTASKATKTFASFLTNSKPPESNESTSVNSFSAAPERPTIQNADHKDLPEVKYYTSLRGLNVSLLAAASRAVEEDPFFNIADLLENYNRLRLTVQKEYDEKASTISQLISSSAPSATQTKPVTLPTPPTSFAGFAPLGSSSSTTKSAAGGFTPSITPSASSTATGFSFLPGTSNPSAPSSGSSLIKPASSAFSLACNTQSDSSSKSETVLTEASSNKLTTSAFSSFPSASASGTATAKPETTSFGGRAPTTSIFGATDKPSSASSLFSTSPSTSLAQSQSPFGGFGSFTKPSGGSIGNPVGFGFGSLAKTSDFGSTSSVNPGGFTFDSSGSKTNDVGSEVDADDGTSDATGADSEKKEDTPEGSVSSALLGSSPHDEEGEGEESEETIYAMKLKAYRMKKSDEKGGPGWVELGVGVLRLKKHKETGVRRLLLRNSSTGKININFNLYGGLKPSHSKKAVTFVGHYEGVSQTYSVRLQNEEKAKDLKEALEREIMFVKETDKQ